MSSDELPPSARLSTSAAASASASNRRPRSYGCTVSSFGRPGVGKDAARRNHRRCCDRPSSFHPQRTLWGAIGSEREGGPGDRRRDEVSLGEKSSGIMVLRRGASTGPKLALDRHPGPVATNAALLRADLPFSVSERRWPHRYGMARPPGDHARRAGHTTPGSPGEAVPETGPIRIPNTCGDRGSRRQSLANPRSPLPPSAMPSRSERTSATAKPSICTMPGPCQPQSRPIILSFYTVKEFMPCRGKPDPMPERGPCQHQP